MNRPITGHIFGLKTKKGIAILQLAEEPPAPTALQLTRICNGFLQEPYTDEDISRVVCQKELFFMKTALRCIHPKSKLYREFFAFDRPFSLPEKLCLPQYLRGYSVQKDGSVNGTKSAGKAVIAGLSQRSRRIFWISRRIAAGACRISANFWRVGKVSVIMSDFHLVGNASCHPVLCRMAARFLCLLPVNLSCK